MLQAGQTNNVTFKVNVMGTSSTPSVRVVLGTDPEMSYSASSQGEMWMAAIKVPEGLEGTYSMRVEVVLNNRLFTPITKSVTISRAEAAAPTPSETTTPSIPTPDKAVEPAPVNVIKAEPVRKHEPILKRDSIVMPQVVAKMPEIRKKAVETDEMLRREIPATIAVDIPPAVVPKKTSGLSMLQAFAEKPAKKVHKRIVTDMPKPGLTKENISVSIASVDAITGPVKAKITETIKTSKARTSVPIKLIKEQLFYE